MKKNLRRLLSLLLAMAMFLTVGVAAAEGNAVIGSAIQYDPSVPVNNGEDIAIEFWYWTGAANLFQAVVDEYTAIHPNVKITLVENPYEDYWTKLPLALQGTDGPAIFNVHNSYHENLIGYLAPYDIPLEDLETDFVGVSAHEIDGKVYYTDYGMMTATMYYNKDMWAAAGLTEADLPVVLEQYEKLAELMLARRREGRPFTFYHYMLDLKGGPCIYKRISGCGSGTEYMAVTPWGDFYPCHQFVGDARFRLGSVREGVTNTALRDAFAASNVYTRPDCADCWARLYCAGGCAANAYHATGSVNGVYKYGCELFRKRMECAIMLEAARALDEE